MPNIEELNNNALFLIKCVHEMQEESVTKLIASCQLDTFSPSLRASNLNIVPVESTALFEFLSYLNLYSLSMIDCLNEHLVFREFTKLLMKENKNCNLTKLDISRNNLTGEDAKYLRDALMSDNCKLTELDISRNNLTDEGTKHLCDALMSDKCKLTKLVLWGNHLTDEGAKHLSDALMSGKWKLIELDISCNFLTDEDVEHLRDAMDSHNCKLTKLHA